MHQVQSQHFHGRQPITHNLCMLAYQNGKCVVITASITDMISLHEAKSRSIRGGGRAQSGKDGGATQETHLARRESPEEGHQGRGSGPQMSRISKNGKLWGGSSRTDSSWQHLSFASCSLPTSKLFGAFGLVFALSWLPSILLFIHRFANS